MLQRVQEDAQGQGRPYKSRRAHFFVMDATEYARNEDVPFLSSAGDDCSGQTITRWHAQAWLVQCMLAGSREKPETVACFAAGGGNGTCGKQCIITPTSEWQQEDARVIRELQATTMVQAASGCSSCAYSDEGIDLMMTLRKVKLLLHRSHATLGTTIYLFVCSKFHIEDLKEWKSVCESIDKAGSGVTVEVVIFGESCSIGDLGACEDLCRCKDETGECLWPLACDSCGRCTVIEPGQDVFQALIQNGLIRKDVDKHWPKYFGEECPELLSKTLKAGTYQVDWVVDKRSNTLSKYYASYNYPADQKRLEEEEDEDEDEDENGREQGHLRPCNCTAPNASSIGCGQQALVGTRPGKPLRFMMNVKVVDPQSGRTASQFLVNPEDVREALGEASKPLVEVRCGRFLKIYGRNPGNLEGKVTLRANATDKGKLELWVSIEGKLKLVYRRAPLSSTRSDSQDCCGMYDDQDDVNRAVLIAQNTCSAISSVSADPSGRSFYIQKGETTVKHFFWLRGNIAEGLEALASIKEYFEKCAKGDSTVGEKIRMASSQLMKGFEAPQKEIKQLWDPHRFHKQQNPMQNQNERSDLHAETPASHHEEKTATASASTSVSAVAIPTASSFDGEPVEVDGDPKSQKQKCEQTGVGEFYFPDDTDSDDDSGPGVAPAASDAAASDAAASGADAGRGNRKESEADQEWKADEHVTIDNIFDKLFPK